MVNNLVSQSSSTRDPNQEGCPTSTLPPIAEQALSFLRETEGVLNWSVLDLARSLKISRRSAELVLIALQAEGYVPMYQLFYDGEEPPKPPILPKRKASGEIAWGSSGKDARFLSKLRRLLGKANEQDRGLILQMAQKMAILHRSVRG